MASDPWIVREDLMIRIKNNWWLSGDLIWLIAWISLWDVRGDLKWVEDEEIRKMTIFYKDKLTSWWFLKELNFLSFLEAWTVCGGLFDRFIAFYDLIDLISQRIEVFDAMESF